MIILLLCIKIFFVRIIDVSLGTLRTIITVKGKNTLASIVGFIEVFVWFVIAREALNTTVDSLWIAISYSLGFATGTYIGGYLSDKFISGTLSVQVVTSKKNKIILSKLRSEGYGLSVVDILGTDDKIEKYMIFIEIDKKRISNLKKLIKEIDNKAFVVVNETKFVYNGYFK